jgi:hypothetical protein
MADITYRNAARHRRLLLFKRRAKFGTDDMVR